MATYKPKPKSIDVSGMSVSDIMGIDIDTFNKLGEKDLRAITSRLVSAGNKRIRRLEKNNVNSPAYQSLGSDKRFSTKLPSGTSKQQRVNKLKQEYARARSFLTSKTSTMKGYKEYQENIIEDIEQSTGHKLKKGEVSKVYEILHKAQERGIVETNVTGKKGGSKGSLQAREIIVNMIHDKNLNEENYFEKLDNEIDKYTMNPDEYEYDDETDEFEI